jgi:cell wall assembly regulator SMI1
MNEAMRESAMVYSSLGDLPFSEIAFMAVNTASMGPIISKGHSGFFKREEYDHNHFSAHLRACIGIDELAVETLVVICQLTDQKVECYGYVYLKDFQIIPVKFASTANFDAWIRGLSEDIDQSEDIILTVEHRSFGVSPAVGPDAFAKPAAFLQKHAPRLYRQAAEQMLKQQYLEDFRLLDSMKQEIDLAETKRLWQRFIALSESAQRCSGAVAESFEAFERAAGFAFPAELQVIYQVNDGAAIAFFGLDLIPLSEVIAAWKEWKAVFDDWSLEELMGNNTSDRNKTLGMYTNPYWIPFIDNVSGNFFGLDLMPNQAGKVGQIIAFGADTDEITCIADSLNQLLLLSIAVIESPEQDNPLFEHFRLAAAQVNLGDKE